MNILYRRFLLVTALITAMGALTANVILETRRPVVGSEAHSPMFSCANPRLCALPVDYRNVGSVPARG
jgi:hypothetical protein